MASTYENVVEFVADAQSRVAEAVAAMTDEQARGASALPGWTRGHVATHLARNADGLRRFVLGVQAGTPAEMYPGGPDARAAAIEEGAGRPVQLLASDLRFAGERLVTDLRRTDPTLLDTPVPWRRPVTARDLPTLRWRELEIHLLDLDLGHTPADWSDAFVTATLDSELPALASAAPDVVVPDLPPEQTLAWLIGRPTRPGLPALPAWPF